MSISASRSGRSYTFRGRKWGPNEYVIGINQGLKILDDLRPNRMMEMNISREVVKALRPVQAAAKKGILSHESPTKTRDELSKLRFLSRGIKVWPLGKGGKSPGGKVGIRGPALQMGKRKWYLKGVAALFGKGAFRTPDRKGHGRFLGYGNFIQDAGDQLEPYVRSRFEAGMRRKMKEIVNRAISRHGLK